MTPAGVFGTHKVEGRQQVAPLAQPRRTRREGGGPPSTRSAAAAREHGHQPRLPTHTLASTAAMWHNNWTSTR
jgi:hypothetical protein